MKTALLLALTWAYLGACIVSLFRPGVVPFAAIVWGGLILISAWWIHDAAHERRLRAYRTREVV
ncbi:hypothetical protein [Microbacterium sp.]|uniref:hypothetical protein n=1 Tax=Microbacterium sp. TaxID=51671 RepID=UPI003A9154A5